MANANHAPGQKFQTLYKVWATGGVGLCISGNIMVDSHHLGEPHNVVIEKNHTNYAELRAWADVKKNSVMKLWLQLNHPGKQSPKFLCQNPLAPSSIPLAPPLDRMFHQPQEMHENQIQDVITRFAFAAGCAKDCGFDGVQIHGAHGYLVSQFLSPHHNQRQDQWGGSLANRMRFVMAIYQAIRAEVGPKFPIGIKLNSADFQKGGFSHEDSVTVAKTLSGLGMDLIEISGGSYENPVMMGNPANTSSRKREAYFLEYTKDIKQAITCPLMVTGGFRSAAFMEEVLQAREVDLIGLARPLAIDPKLPLKLLNDPACVSSVHPLSTGWRALDRIIPLEIVWYTQQLHRMGKGNKPKPKASVYTSILQTLLSVGKNGLKRVRAK